MFQWAGHITTPSADLKNKIIDLYNIKSEKIYILPNIIDTNHFRPMQNLNQIILRFLHLVDLKEQRGLKHLPKLY